MGCGGVFVGQAGLPWAVRWSPVWAEAAARWAWAASLWSSTTLRSSLVLVMGVALEFLGGVGLDAKEELRGVGGGGLTSSIWRAWR